MMNETELKSKGYEFNSDKNWWARTWSTNDGSEQVQEVAAYFGLGEVRKIMIDENGEVFYEGFGCEQRYGEPMERPTSDEHHGGKSGIEPDLIG